MIDIFKEAEFEERMKTEVAPWLQDCVRDGYLTSFDGSQIHYYYAHNEAKEGAIVISHGFCEFFGKYHELAYYFYQMGYSIYFVDHRGHGYSERKVEEWDKVYVKDYGEYVEDFKAFLDKFVLPEMAFVDEDKEKLYLYAHSMGGCIGALFLEQYPGYFSKAVLSSPLMKMNVGKYKPATVKLLMAGAKLFHMDLKYVPGQHGFDGVNVFETSSTLCKPRYDYVFKQRLENDHFKSYGGCYAWTRASLKAVDQLLANADKITIPVLLCQAGRDTMVMPEGHASFCQKAKQVTFIRFEDSKHEIFNALDDIVPEYYQKLFDFLQS